VEQWRDIEGYEGLYQVSDLGRVRSLDRVVPHARFGTMRLKGRIVSLVPHNQSGYFISRLHKEGVERTFYVHRLVAAAWIGPCPNGKQVRHGTNGHLDNSTSNLSYGTRSQNELDKRRDGTHGGRRVVRGDGIEFINMHAAAEESGCSASNICKVCNGRRKSAGGYSWRYADTES